MNGSSLYYDIRMQDGKKTDLSNLPLSAIERSAPHLSDDDVNLLELWRTLAKRKGVVLAILLVSLIVAGLSIFLVSPVYESHAVLQIGRIWKAGQTELVESPAILVKRVAAQDDLNQDQAAIGKRPFIHSAFLEKETNLVSIIARGPAPDAAREYLAQVVEKVMHEHQELFDLARKKQQQSLDLMQVRGHSLNQTMAANEKEMAMLAKQPPGANTFAALGIYILASERSRMLEQRMSIEQRQIELQTAMSALQSKPTILIKAPTLSANPVKPRPLFYLALAIGIGLMLGAFGAFATEFISKARRLPAT